MSQDPYEAWKRQRAGVPVPGDFADRVLAGLLGETRRQGDKETRRQQKSGFLLSPFLPLSLSPCLSKRAARIGIGSLAAAVCLCRILQVVALFLTGSAGR